MITVIIPTVTGREDHFNRCLDAYLTRSSQVLEVITVRDRPTVGMAWQAGAAEARGDYVHLTCDDLEPLAGWDEAAMAVCEAGAIPSPNVTNAHTGALESRPVWNTEFADGIDAGVCTVPFMSRPQWEKIQPLCQIHYYSDDFISFRARSNGWPSLVCNKYAFRHHWAQVKRGAGMTEGERMATDQHVYVQAVGMVRNGQWDKPWPPGGKV